MPLSDQTHAQRTALADELHARPFQKAALPGRVLHVAFLPEAVPSERNHAADIEHLFALLDRYGAAHPAPDATYHVADLGPVRLKWERHTEFLSYTFFDDAPTEALFSQDLSGLIDEEWTRNGPGPVIAAIQCEFIKVEDEREALKMLRGPMADTFMSDSLAGSLVLDGNAIAAGDFHVHTGGWTRFGLIVFGETGPRRLGRISQRLIELEVYRTLAMLALPVARQTMGRLNEIEHELAGQISNAAQDMDAEAEASMLNSLTLLSADIEALFSESAFRFGSAHAYEAIVKERIQMLREERVGGRQLFREFMSRRFDPAMRTVFAAEGRLKSLSERAARGAELLRTRVNVSMEAQNQDLLESMNERADMQIRLQRTVEGLSVVAVSYYATSLASYILAPIAKIFDFDKTFLTAAIAIPIVIAVYLMVKRAGRRLSEAHPRD